VAVVLKAYKVIKDHKVQLVIQADKVFKDSSEFKVI
jgi:hypothetical protein